MTVDEILKDIRRQCRLAMNGVVSSRMREQGLNYKLNFGVSIQRIKAISQKYQQDDYLAEVLWKEDTRELKILATLLYPLPKFHKQTAERWMEEISNQEIREQICINLFQNLPFADEVALKWSNSENETNRITGYWLTARLLLQKKSINTSLEAFTYLIDDVRSRDNISLRNAALSVLKYLGRFSNSNAKEILSRVKRYENSENVLEKEIYDSLKFELEFYS